MLLRHLKEAWQERKNVRHHQDSLGRSIVAPNGALYEYVLIVKVHPDAAPVGSANVRPVRIGQLVHEYNELLGTHKVK